jgi:demethylmenaquinone methyltransferase/2-methoxy-6-polyprenyl-1,4-benzoquinol methylase
VSLKSGTYLRISAWDHGNNQLPGEPVVCRPQPSNRDCLEPCSRCITSCDTATWLLGGDQNVLIEPVHSTEKPEATAARLFREIAGDYQRWASILSLGQDGRWRRLMVGGIQLAPRSRVLDVAAGTGSISRLLEARGYRVVAVDLSHEMLSHHSGRHRVRAVADHLPFREETFDAITFGYLLRYVEDPVAALQEMSRVLRPGGLVGMVEFGQPRGIVGPLWRIYTRAVLPWAGAVIGPGWHEVGRFLGPSIERFHQDHPNLALPWEEGGLVDVTVRRPSLGGGLVMWARKP